MCYHDGAPLPEGLHERLLRECERLALVEKQAAALEKAYASPNCFDARHDKAQKSFTAYYIPHNARPTATRVAPTKLTIPSDAEWPPGSWFLRANLVRLRTDTPSQTNNVVTRVTHPDL